MSIIDSKYKDRYKAKDWLGTFIDEQASEQVQKSVPTKNEDGSPGPDELVPVGKPVLNLDKFFALTRANAIDTASMEAQRDQKNAPGRIRMTLGNSLRAAAKKRHGLNTIDGTFVEAPAEFLGDATKTHNPDGSKIVVEKATAPEGEPAPTE